MLINNKYGKKIQQKFNDIDLQFVYMEKVVGKTTLFTGSWKKLLDSMIEKLLRVVSRKDIKTKSKKLLENYIFYNPDRYSFYIN